MATHFGGISPVRQQQKAKALGLVLGVALVVCLAIVGFLFVSSGPVPATTPGQPASAAPAPVDTVEVLIPVQKVEAGEEFKITMFRKEARPQAGLPQRVVRDFEEIKSQFARSMIVADQPLVMDYVTHIKPSNVITASIPDGYRAVTIQVDAQSAVEGWARPGVHVDVIWATSNRGEKIVTTIVHNAKVLSAEASTDPSMTNAQGQQHVVPNTVTLLVTMKDAQKIQLARTAGALSLLLRGDTDGKASDGGPISMDDVLGLAKRNDSGDKVDGSVIIGGKKFNVVDGKMKEVAEEE